MRWWIHFDINYKVTPTLSWVRLRLGWAVTIIPEVLPIELKGFSIEACLEKFISPESMTRTCTKCKNDTATQITTFIRNPQTLILQLKRFEFDQENGNI